MTHIGEIATRVLRNARIITFDQARPRASAIAVRGERILAIGGDEVVAAAGTDAEVIDLGGACVIPGFNDTHAHMEREGLKLQRPSLAGARTVGEILERVRAAAAATPAGQWIVTMPVGSPPFYFDGPEALVEKRMPDRHQLDAVAPDNPVYIPGVFGNWGKPPGYSALNSRALALNGITGATAPRCAGVEILRDASGDPTGVIIERNNRPTVEFDILRAVPRFGFDERIEGVRISQRLYNAKGTTSIYEGHGSVAQTISVYRRLWELGELSVRVGLVVSPSWSDLAEAGASCAIGFPWRVAPASATPGCGCRAYISPMAADPVVADCAGAHLPDTGWTGFVEQAVSPSDFHEACFLAPEHDLRLHTIAGFAADLAALSDDPTAVPVERIRYLSCILTMVGGRIVHRIRA